jgi:hypothetical protein
MAMLLDENANETRFYLIILFAGTACRALPPKARVAASGDRGHSSQSWENASRGAHSGVQFYAN